MCHSVSLCWRDDGDERDNEPMDRVPPQPAMPGGERRPRPDSLSDPRPRPRPGPATARRPRPANGPRPVGQPGGVDRRGRPHIPLEQSAFVLWFKKASALTRWGVLILLVGLGAAALVGVAAAALVTLVENSF
jgi:hypothetical protein